ncbi:MAG TPA: transglycosylase domain-containing protein [Chryseosolibacter sp.]|nr:transglycosylase domain-containing protein [Chryseosolibacter sp.]
MRSSKDKIKHFFIRNWKGKTAVQRLLRILVLSFLTIISGALFFVFLVWLGVFGPLPDKKDLLDINNPIASEVYSADSVLLGRYYIEERSYLKPTDIPESLKKILVATEDARFYQHSGIDYRSLARVLVKTLLLQNESAGGGSTLTQQLAKNLFPRKSFGFLSLPVNKVREFIVARRLENLYTKDEILVLYLNTVPFADNTYGIKTAAERFFSVSVNGLSYDQSAVLVGMLKANHYYNPRLFPERSLQRRNVVLAQARKYGFISEAENESLQAKPLGIRLSTTSGQGQNAGLAPYFRSHIKKELVKWCEENRKPDGSPYNLYKDGLKIYTSIDARVQEQAERAVMAHMKVLQEKFSAQLSKSQLDKIASQKVKTLPQFKALKAQGLNESQIMARLKKPELTKVFSWEGERQVKMSIYDSVKHHIRFLQTGLMAMDPHSGNILAWVGGIDHQYFKFDHVRQSTKRQIGSTFKPIVYAAALENGIGPCSYISARKTVYTNMDDWAPENTDDDTYDKKYSMEGGLSESVNTVSVKLIEKTGIRNAINVARKMGIESELPAVPSIALGTPSISVKEMVAAYSVFASGGMYHEPRYLLSITDRRGKVLHSFESEKPQRAISKETAQMMIHMLESVVSGGTASSLRHVYGLSNDIAGKTGTTQSNVDGWFIAISPAIVVGAWVGSDDPRLHFKTTTLGQGAATALPIVAKLFQNANKDEELRLMMQAKFDPLSERLLNRLDCAPSKSDANFLQRLFNIKKKTKVTKFKGKKRGGGIFARDNKKKD